MSKTIELHVNGVRQRIDVDPEASLLGVLRDGLGLTGSKYGCGEGLCGACTVLIDGAPARSCVTPAGGAAGKRITTIEGLEKDGRMHPLQEAFLEAEALQCGYCTPGMIISGVALLKKTPNPTVRETIDFMKGHICRCGTYPRILAAIGKTAKRKKESGR
jgi:aerobic-type carbon monoxide dehydrogenase small subunit (CoxS/CutS family)